MDERINYVDKKSYRDFIVTVNSCVLHTTAALEIVQYVVST